MPIIIGVTGTLSSGKDEFSKYLISKGFVHISLSDILRDELASRNAKITRDSLREIGNQMREERGLGVLASIAMQRMNQNDDYVITSIRNPHEIMELKKLPNFLLLKLDAPVELRFHRALKRNREEEKRTIDEFKLSEQVELTSNNPANQQLVQCMQLADAELINDGTIDQFHAKIDDLLEELR